MSDNAHAKNTLAILRQAEREGIESASESIAEIMAEHETVECAICERTYLDKGEAVQCCSDEFRSDGGDAA